MKFCENCGTQLDDNAVFCEECGTKQENFTDAQTDASNNATEEKQVYNNSISPKTKKDKSWFPVVLLVAFSPIILMLVMSTVLLWLPEILFWIIYVGLQLFALVFMWKKCKWKTWIKVTIIGIYILMYLI